MIHILMENLHKNYLTSILNIGQDIFCDFSWEGGGNLHLSSYTSLFFLYEKLHCKREPYRFSSERDPSVQTYTEILLLLNDKLCYYIRYTKDGILVAKMKIIKMKWSPFF